MTTPTNLSIGSMSEMWADACGGSISGMPIRELDWKGCFQFQSWRKRARKIFYPPDGLSRKAAQALITKCCSSGPETANTQGYDVINRLFAVRDKNPSTPLTGNDLMDVTLDLLQDPGPTMLRRT